MNYLAHALLSPSSPEWRLGNLCADRVKGSDILALTEEVQSGIRLHRLVDSFTDQHELNKTLRTKLPLEYQRYTGILLDVYGDHMLARDFGRYSSMPLDDFLRSVYGDLESVRHLAPVNFLKDLESMVRYDWLGSYVKPDSVTRMLTFLSSRLKRANPLQNAPDILFSLDSFLTESFQHYWETTVLFTRERAAKSALLALPQ